MSVRLATRESVVSAQRAGTAVDQSFFVDKRYRYTYSDVHMRCMACGFGLLRCSVPLIICVRVCSSAPRSRTSTIVPDPLSPRLDGGIIGFTYLFDERSRLEALNVDSDSRCQFGFSRRVTTVRKMLDKRYCCW